MIRKLGFLSILFSLLACSQNQEKDPNQNKEYNSNVIYGDDHRLDIYQLTDLDWIAAAQSTVAIVDKKKVLDEGTHYQLKHTEFGNTYGLCSDEPFYDQPISAFCTGFLVGPDVVVTAGHCIRNEYGCEKARFVFNYTFFNSSDDPTMIDKSDVFECKEVIHTETDALTGSDFAIIRLKEKVTHYDPLPLQLSSKIDDDQSLTVIGHPSGLPAKWANGANVRANNEDSYFVANLDTYGGNSGSPVFNSQTKKVEGILVRGESDYKYDVDEKCRRSNRCADDECRGEDVVRISSILDYIEDSDLEPLPQAPSPTLLTPPIHF